MKAVTPVIAIVMLMLITVGMVGMTYTWFSSMMTTQTEKNIAIPVGGIQCINNRISAIVTNTGANSNITDDDIVVADVNGVNVRNTPFFGGFNTNGLVGYWRFEQSSGSAATNDSSGYGNMGTLTNMNLTGNATSGPTLGGRFGSALQFDGVNDYVDVPAMPIANWSSDSWSATAWASLATGTAANYRGIITNRVDGGASGFWTLGTYVDGTIQLEWRFFGAQNYITTGVSPAGAGWKHYAIVKNGNTLSVYVDGVYNNGADVTTGTLGLVTNTMKIGRWYDTDQIWNGTIDEVQIWNRILTQDEITQLNKTNAANFTLAPNKAVTLINGYTVFQKGRYTVRIGTRNGVIERAVECL